MKRKAAIVFVAVGVIAVGLLVWCLVPSREPRYEGRTVTDWLYHPRPPEYMYLPKIDPNALPYLIKALRSEDSFLKTEYANLRQKTPLWIQHSLPEPPVPAQVSRVKAFLGIVSLGSDAKPAVPALLQYFNHRDDMMTRSFCLELLARLDRSDASVKKALDGALKDKDPNVRRTAERLVYGNIFSF